VQLYQPDIKLRGEHILQTGWKK